jgi:putative adhesin
MQDQTFNVTGPVRVEVRIPNADLTVATGQPGSASVAFGGGTRPDDVTVTCERRGDTDVLTVSSKQSGLFKFRRALPLDVRVPEGSALLATTAAGGIACTGPLGAVRIETASAGVRIPEAASADVIGVSGEVVIGRVAGEASVKTVSGAIQVDDVRGRLVLRTVSGRIRVHGAGGDVEARSVSGDVQLQRLEQGVVRLDSVSGDVTLGVRRGVAVWLDLDSASGDVRSDLGGSGDGPGDDRPVLELRGRTVSGDVRVTSVEA